MRLPNEKKEIMSQKIINNYIENQSVIKKFKNN